MTAGDAHWRFSAEKIRHEMVACAFLHILHTVNLVQSEKWWQAKVTTYWREIVPEINVNVRDLKRRATKAGHLVAIRS